MTNSSFTMALPSKGAIANPTYDFLKGAGLKIRKPNPRQYTGLITTLPDVNLLFQRVKDIAYKVADNTAQLGITGYDIVQEFDHENLIVIHDQLGYGQCELVIAVPESWVDVASIDDLIDVALDFREHKGRNIRVATTYTNLARQFLHKSGIHHFTLAKADGAIEAAPTIGYADIVVDLTQTGTTLRENHLKMISGGTIVESQACLIGNRQALTNDRRLLETLSNLLERIDASIIGRKFQQLTVNICGESADDVGRKVISNPLTAGLQGPTISPLFNAIDTDNHLTWYSVVITIETKFLMFAVKYLRSIGGKQIITTSIESIFLEQSPTFTKLLEQLDITL